MSKVVKELLGDLYTPQIEAALKGTEIVKKSDFDGYIPKDRFNEVNDAKKLLKKEVDKLTGDIESLSTSTSDIEELKKQLTEKTTEFEEFQTGIETKQLNDKKMSALIAVLKGENVLNPKLLAREFEKEKLSFDGDGKLTGYRDTLENCKTNYAQQFGEVVTESVQPNTNNKGTAISKEQFSKMTYTERNDLYKNNQSVYESLTK